MATTMVNGTPGAEGNTNSVTMPGKQQSKPAAAGSKTADGNRKQASNAGDGAQRRNPPQKAWTSGMNPITQRSTTPGQQNGAGSQIKIGAQKAANNQEANTAEKLGHDRLLSLLGSSIGLIASLTMKNGDIFSGIFFGASMEQSEPAYLLKMVQQTKSAENSEVNGMHENMDDCVGVGEDHAMSFNIKDVIDFAVEGVSLGAHDKYQNGSTTGFRTDADISGNLALRERNLQRWAPSSAETDVDLSLDDSGQPWDQFQANEKLFGLKSDYDENIYTTSIDRSDPLYRQREAAASRLAQEIEGTSTNNAHIREERGIVDDDGALDEEEKYSGVRRHGTDYPPLQSSQPNRYMPPARRPPSGKPTVAGAPVDPAIISSQIARPDASPQGRHDPPPKNTENNVAVAGSGDDTPKDPKKEATKDGSTGKAAVVSTSRPVDAAKAPPPNATANVETEVLDSFRNFANFEKMRVADDRRKRVSHDKAIKLNDLKKFSTNFKLHTPVPKDLVPILAKDKAKQEEIVEKAHREAEQKAATPPRTLPSSGDQTSSRVPPDPKQDSTRVPPSVTERQDYTHPRQGFPPRGPQAGISSREKQQQFSNMFPASPQNGQGMLSHRLADNHSRHKAGMPVSVPTPLPIHSAQKPSRPVVNAGPVPNSQTSSTVRTPTSAVSAKFNVKALEFKPNPAANAFKPTGFPSAASSPRSNANVRSLSRAPSPSDFFGDKKPLPAGERPSILDNFNPLKRLREKAQNEGKAKDYAANGGIVYAHATPVTWSNPTDDEHIKSYKDMYEDVPAASRGASPQTSTVSPVNQALLHQLPPHLQHGPQGAPQLQPPQQQTFQVPPQPHHYPGVPHHFDEHRMHASPSASSMHSTPRIVPVAAYQPMQPIPYAYAHPAPPHAMGPGAPQPHNFRPFHGGPYGHSPGQQFAAPMMVPNSSQGPFMGPHGMPGPQMPMFPPGQGPPYQGQSQPPSGYPSPGRGAPMMMHQGSYQGQNPQMYMGGPVYAQQPPPHTTPMRGYASPQPHYNQSPQQQANHYPPQISRVPSNSYGHHPQGQYQHIPAQHPPPGVPMDGGDVMK